MKSSFDLDQSLTDLETFRTKTTDVFSGLITLAESVAEHASEIFLLSAQETNLAFCEMFLGIESSFGAAVFTMGEEAVALWSGLDEGFAETWSNIGADVDGFFEVINTNFAELWMGIDTGFAELWIALNESTVVFRDQMNTDFAELWMGLDTGFTVLWTAINGSAVEICNQMTTGFSELWLGLDTGFNNFWSDINAGTVTLHGSISASTDGLLTELTNGYTGLWNRVSERFNVLWGNIRTGNSSLWKDTDTASSTSINSVSDGFSTMWEAVGLGNDGLWTDTKDGTATMLEGLYTDFNTFWSDIPEGTKSMAREVCDVLNKLLSWLISPINSIIRGFNKIPFVNLSEIHPTISPPAFAQGGFPAQGQMFIAREAGPELVGTIGSRSAVVNNEQIVESVSRGVYDAVRTAMTGGKSSNNSTAEFHLYLDSQQITTAVERVQNERGLPLLKGGLAYA